MGGLNREAQVPWSPTVTEEVTEPYLCCACGVWGSEGRVEKEVSTCHGGLVSRR